MPDRIKSMEGVLNFRDFGGYTVQQGGSVRRDLLFRSAHLANATDADKAYIDGLGVDFQVDLRRKSERERQPNLWSAAIVHAHEAAADQVAPHIQYFMSGEVTADGARGFMLSFYEGAYKDPYLIDLYTRWFEALDTHEGAALIHCAAGKDRTGIACAMTLELLGVSDEDVMIDYEKTNQAYDVNEVISEAKVAMDEAFERNLPREALFQMFTVHADYLNTALDEIRTEHGSVAAYAGAALGVDDAQISRLRDRLVI